MWSSNLSLIREKIYTFVILLYVDLCGWNVPFPLEDCSSISVWMLSFYPLLWRLCSSIFGNYFISSYRFIASVGGGKIELPILPSYTLYLSGF